VLYPELVTARNNKTSIEVTGLRRVRGGILAAYKDMPLFLPTSHLSLKSNPSENELLGLIKKTFPVHVHELDESDKSKVIISRRRMLRNDMLNEFKVGQVVEGKVASVTDFGAFVNLGGVDGMVHVSAMSRRRVGHPSEIVQKGDTVKAVVMEINANTQRLALSMKELEADPWTGAAQEFAPGTKHTGKIKSLTDFGAYVELKPGVEGLVHISEMSWARRIKHPSELFQAGQEITVQVLEISEEKHKVALGYKQTQPNPWETIAQRFSVGQVITGTVKEVLQKGVVISVAEDIDAFMPRGKMHPSARTKNAPFEVGQVLDSVLVMDVEPTSHSLIIGMEGFDQGARPERESRGERGEGRGERGERPPRQKREDAPAIETSAPVTLADMLSEEEKRKLFGE
jgi:small subunit ribosomal protein S1